jgi:hypothetical protein
MELDRFHTCQADLRERQQQVTEEVSRLEADVATAKTRREPTVSLLESQLTAARQELSYLQSTIKAGKPNEMRIRALREGLVIRQYRERSALVHRLTLELRGGGGALGNSGAAAGGEGQAGGAAEDDEADGPPPTSSKEEEPAGATAEDGAPEVGAVNGGLSSSLPTAAAVLSAPLGTPGHLAAYSTGKQVSPPLHPLPPSPVPRTRYTSLLIFIFSQ